MGGGLAIFSCMPTTLSSEVALTQVKMLETLQDIEIASRLVGFDADNKESLDEKYKKLRFDIALLLHNSNDYRLIENYLICEFFKTLNLETF
ncbi:Poly [ADP-ribose] polymerase 1 [Camellia lanceoleosa]|uniref:Poly [ADP-ribose] polymerase 1 n=1 Tax=Camellia lanceoleosa TaxID=1840588 RepID=A0ACC0HHU5_9ERIC|nr:Poly [ADP-ribose] polymerase 1 [Camellia lanceoleosa]